MPTQILILTSAGDLHSYAVAEALRRKGGNPLIWHTTDFPSRSGETLCFDGDACSLHVEGLDSDLSTSDVKSVWRRRPAHVVDESGLHPADREFAQLECAIFRRSLLPIVFQEAFWVNPPDAAVSAGRKMVQHKLAAEMGLKAPATIFTNDPRWIRRFMALQGGKIIYKTFQASSWENDEERWFSFTSLLTESDLVEDSLLRATPGIYQEVVPKDHELRITVMGNQVFAVKIFSQETESGELDWRKSGSALRFEPSDLQLSIKEGCVTLLKRLGLVFGCIDFIVTPKGDHVFLEVNEMGQFLFLEQKTGLPLLDAFTEFLLQGRVDFDWPMGTPCIRYADVAQTAEEQSAEALRLHVGPPSQSSAEEEPDQGSA
ncbi:MAG TPA: hypothetical protein VLB76_02615 [Thermoanaerobaculia bacterium]|jgi:hypothetical protein|nr:hypothetical protein [Thermoanaerobaculia bacterium]